MAKLIDLPDAKGRYPYTYVPAARTDLRARFAAERKRLDALDAEARADVAKVTQIKRRGKK